MDPGDPVAWQLFWAIGGALAVGLSLGIFGSGGSILTVPALVYLLKHEPKAAIAESLAIVGTIALVGAIPGVRARLVAWRTAAFFALPGMVGTAISAQVSSYVPSVVQLLVFALVMGLAARRMWKGRKAGDHERGENAPRDAWRIALDGLGVGLLTGFVGVGGGFLIVPALALLSGVEMKRAIATSLVIITLNSAIGFWRHSGVLEAGSIHWPTVSVFMVFGSAGSLTGRVVGARIYQAKLKKGFAVFLMIMAVAMVAREIGGAIATERGFGSGGEGFQGSEPAGSMPLE